MVDDKYKLVIPHFKLLSETRKITQIKLNSNHPKQYDSEKSYFIYYEVRLTRND